ncbi:MAG TPA: alpha/beta hydrolase [Burkholderiales bacterium]|nr:alpha/beta hydrolase [Burkholderiales bacterium]
MFVHGFCCSHEDWLLQIDALKRRFEIVACDLRGHGLTPGQPFECSIEHFGGDVAALAANLDLRKVVLVGHSMGCRVVLEAARLAPEPVAGIVLIDGSRQGSGDPDAAEAAARAAIDKAGYRAFAESLFRQMFFSPSALAEAIVARALRRPEAIGAALWPRMARWDAAEGDAALRAVRCPLLAIQSTTRDPLTLKRAPLKPGESSPWLDIVRGNVPQARIEVLAGLGHFPQLEAPAAVNRLIEAFVDRLLQASR